ncbi:1,2-phenylacetyl-CoA epoxidase subunit PaaC [Actinoplanes sp. NPDC089786]|uniref:1,2-phenylacetyl-CoA epoxidase subunit PaaC n=1 Tax=Actinoplanes sp. NPDC089786 TaxID=3155185 RepID=UPI003426104F
MSFDDAYGALTDHDDDARWAYGTGFADPLAGVPTAFSPAADRPALASYCLMLGDDALIMSHRLQEWVTRAPELEDEVAIANIALDLLGQARLLLTRAGEALGDGNEDALAYGRGPAEFRNVQLAERADPDFAHLVARLLAFSTWRLAVLDRLRDADDPVLAAVAAKAVKELTYHREYAAQWVIRLGDGTDLSRERMQSAVDALWPLLAELDHEPSPLAPKDWRPEFDAVMAHVLSTATLTAPAPVDNVAEPSDPSATFSPTQRGGGGGGARETELDLEAPASSAPTGRDGVHTPALAEVLDEMQSLARSVPGGVW